MENKKIHLIAKIVPYDLKFALIFDSKETIYEIFYFIDETMRKNKLKYKTGRIEKNKIIIFPQFLIKDFLENNDEIIVYPIEYGLNLKQLNDNDDFEFEKEDINKIYINRKTKRKDKDSKSYNTTRKNSKEFNKITENNSNKSDDEEENIKKNKKKYYKDKEESDDDENNSNNSDKSDNEDNKNEENEEEENSNNKNNKSNDDSDNDDIQIPRNKKK